MTNMQWFYGDTWGRTLRVCERLSAFQRRAGCAREDEVCARQLELIEVLRRNVAHAAVVEVGETLTGRAQRGEPGDRVYRVAPRPPDT